MEQNRDLLEELVTEVRNHTNLEHWPKICEKCKKRITKTIFLRMHFILPDVPDDYIPTGEEEITIVKESYCKKCSKSIESGMVVEMPLPREG